MTLTDQLGMIEAENNRLKLELESSKASNQRQAGALKESRAQNSQLIARNEKLSARCAYLEKHFYDFHGSAEQIERQRKDIAEQAQPNVAEIVNSPAHVATIKERIARIIARDEKATNGAAH